MFYYIVDINQGLFGILTLTKQHGFMVSIKRPLLFVTYSLYGTKDRRRLPTNNSRNRYLRIRVHTIYGLNITTDSAYSSSSKSVWKGTMDHVVVSENQILNKTSILQQCLRFRCFDFFSVFHESLELFRSFDILGSWHLW